MVDFHLPWRRCWLFLAFLVVKGEWIGPGIDTIEHEVAEMQAAAKSGRFNSYLQLCLTCSVEYPEADRLEPYL